MSGHGSVHISTAERILDGDESNPKISESNYVVQLDLNRSNVSSDLRESDESAESLANHKELLRKEIVAGGTIPRSLLSESHSWCPAESSTFLVRHGPNYRQTGLKEPSQPALYDIVGCDLFSSENGKVDCIWKRLNLPIPPYESPDSLWKMIPPLLVINMQLPKDAPSMFATAVDGPTLNFVFYFAISAQTAKELAGSEPLSASLQLLRDYCLTAESEPEVKGRFKAIGIINNLEEAGIPTIISQYNGKPVLVTRSGALSKHYSESQKCTLLEMDCNVRYWCYLARKGLYHLLPKFTDISLNVAFVLEGRVDEELPEQILGCCSLFGIDPEKAIPLT